MPKFKKDELEHVREGLHVTDMTKAIQALSGLNSTIDLISTIGIAAVARVMSHCFFFYIVIP